MGASDDTLVVDARGGIPVETALLVPHLRRFTVVSVGVRDYLFINGRIVGPNAAEDFKRALRAEGVCPDVRMTSTNQIDGLLGPSIEQMVLEAAVEADCAGNRSGDGPDADPGAQGVNLEWDMPDPEVL